MFFTYMMASRKNGTLYTGHTDGLASRVEQHQRGEFDGFTAKYGVDRLVWYETHPSRDAAFKRERLIKHWRRAWKLSLIENVNPLWQDLGPDMIEFRIRHGWTPPCAYFTGYATVEIERGPLAEMAVNV
jgi:putative endonuclease